MKQEKQEKTKYNPPEWIKEALSTLKPPENLTVSEWADIYRILDVKTSNEPGRWSTSRTPYLKEIMDTYNDADIEETAFLKPTQVGGTECLNNITGYIIAQDSASTIIVLPTGDIAEYASNSRIRPMIRLCPELSKKFLENKSKILELQFSNDMDLSFGYAGSATSLSSKPKKNVLADEIDKNPKFAGKEADPLSLATERQRTFTFDKFTFKTSTPTTKLGPIWQAWERADVRCKFYVPCPHCGHMQNLKFKGGIKWPEGAKTAEERRATAYYECENCKGIITDIHKPQMLRSGIWKDEITGKNFKDITENKRKVAFTINAIYSPWVRFGDVAYEFTQSKNYPEKLMNFVNSWLAEPWNQTEVKMNSSIVLDRETKYEENIIPNEALLITSGIDVQKDRFYFTVRAWGSYMTSWNITHGMVSSWNELEDILNRPFKKANNQLMQVNLAAIDSGDQTDEIYDLCAMNQDWLVPIKGSSRPLLSRYKVSMIDKVNSKANGMKLYMVDGGQYKDMIAGRLNRPNGKGSWMVHSNCDLDYAEQICSEEKVPGKNGVFIWQPKVSNGANHYLDCEVYAALAADLLQVRYLQEEPQQQQPSEKKQQNQSGFIKNTDSWIHNSSNWIR
ncbi:MAG: terminase gpA endonuclease subunit [Candidatus Gastranaerophilaceae bacterium]